MVWSYGVGRYVALWCLQPDAPARVSLSGSCRCYGNTVRASKCAECQMMAGVDLGDSLQAWRILAYALRLGYLSSALAAPPDNAPEVIAGQNVQNGDKGPPVLLGRPYEPRNHAVLLRQCGAAPSLCIRFGHDLTSSADGLAERPS